MAWSRTRSGQCQIAKIFYFVVYFTASVTFSYRGLLAFSGIIFLLANLLATVIELTDKSAFQ